VVLAAEAHVPEGRGDGDRGRALLGVGDAERRAVRLEEGEDLLVEPGGMAELEGDFSSRGERAQARGQALDMEGEVRRQLEEEGAAALAERGRAFDEGADRAVRLLQPGAMGDLLRGLQGEAKRRWRLFGPGAEHGGIGHAIEGVVDLDGREAPRVE